MTACDNEVTNIYVVADRPYCLSNMAEWRSWPSTYIFEHHILTVYLRLFVQSNLLRISYYENQVPGIQPVGTDIRLRAGRTINRGSIPEKRMRLFSILHSNHTGSVAQPASYSIDRLAIGFGASQLRCT